MSRRLPVLFLTEGRSHYVGVRFRGTHSVCGLYPHVHRPEPTTPVLSVHLPTCRRCLAIAKRRPTRVLVQEAT